MANQTILRHAHAYLEQGWRIFPVDAQKRPANARPYAETAADAHRWWANGAKFGIAAATGQGLLVLDIDMPQGPASFVRLEEELEPTPPTRMSRTPSGGAQLFFRVPSRLSHKASIGALAPGIDTKCNASYIVMPPSYGCYTKDLGSGPVEIRGHWEWWTTDDFAELPRAWQDAILALDKPPTRGAAGKARSHDIDELVAGARTNNGSWHNNVVRLVGNLVSRGRDDSEILAWAYDITCPGFSIDQTRADLAKMIAGARAKGWSPPPLDDGWTCASDIAPKDVEFLWEPRLIASKINLLAALGGAGKDILCSDIIARVTTGAEWPDGARGCTPGTVGIYSSEDDADDAIVPRLIAAGADRSRVRIWTKKGKRPTPPDIAGLNVLIASPLIDLMKREKEMNREQDVREFLGLWDDRAREVGCMAIGVVHLNKKNDLSVVQRILGASGLTNAPRSGWSVQKDDEDPTERLFLPLKWNYLPEGTAGLRFRIKHVGPWQQSVRCEWLGETAKRADEVMAATTSGEVSAPQWLIRYLQEHGETERDQVMKDAANAGFKEETIQKAKARKANILDNRVGWPGKSCWRLAE